MIYIREIIRAIAHKLAPFVLHREAKDANKEVEQAENLVNDTLSVLDARRNVIVYGPVRRVEGNRSGPNRHHKHT